MPKISPHIRYQEGKKKGVLKQKQYVMGRSHEILHCHLRDECHLDYSFLKLTTAGFRHMAPS